MGQTPPPVKGVGNPFLKGFFGFDNKKIQKNLGDERREQRNARTTERGNDRMRERRIEGTTERGNDWNDTTLALLKILVI